jgi:hypothetical protein
MSPTWTGCLDLRLASSHTPGTGFKTVLLPSKSGDFSIDPTDKKPLRNPGFYTSGCGDVTTSGVLNGEMDFGSLPIVESVGDLTVNYPESEFVNGPWTGCLCYERDNFPDVASNAGGWVCSNSFIITYFCADADYN